MGPLWLPWMALVAYSTAYRSLRETLTYEQGKEMIEYNRLTEMTGVAVFFADPHSPWQRGSNEITNGPLREYLP